MRIENHKREYPSSVRMNNNQGLTLHGDKMGFTTTGYWVVDHKNMTYNYRYEGREPQTPPG